MAHAQRAIPKRLYAEGEYMGHYFGRANDPRNEDDGITECIACNGRGWVNVLHDDGTPVRMTCEVCEGERYLDESGYPYKPQEEA
jgi:hypothetical protein